MSVRVRYALMGAAVLAASVSPVVCQTGGSGGRAAVYAFENVMVLPMDRAGAIAGQTVLVRDGTIAAVGDAGDVRIPPEATVIEGAGRYLMPGLAEMHAHVPPQQNPPRDVLEDIFFLYIANGVTTIRGMLGRSYQIALADELERGEILGPTFYVGAPSLNGNSAPDPETAERLVRRHKSEGYDLQKIHPGLSRATWNHMAATAREVGLTFAGHVPQAVGLSHALETGLSTVDHLDGYVVAVASDAVGARAEAGEQVGLADIVDAVDEAKVDAIVQQSLERDVYVVPTMYLWENLYGKPDADAFLSQPEMRYVSRAQRDGWRRQAANRPPLSTDAIAKHNSLRKRILKRLADAGVGILMGTDSPQMFNVPGFALHREIAVMADAGMTHQQILESGTITVARYVRHHLGLDGNFGTVAPGQRADLVLLRNNPLDDLANLKDRVGVMVRGRWVTRAEIDAGLERLAAKHAG